MFWWLWFGLAAFAAGTLLGAYAWNGALLGVVNGQKGKKYWTVSVALSALGLVTLTVSALSLAALTYARFAVQTLDQFWFAVALMSAGALLTAATTLKRFDARHAFFYAGLILLAAGFAALLWLMFPDNLLYGVIVE